MFDRLFCEHDYKKICVDGNEEKYFIFCECKKCHKRKVYTNCNSFGFFAKNIIKDWEHGRITKESLKEILE